MYLIFNNYTEFLMFYDFDDYLNTIKYLDKEDILSATYKKHKMLDKVSGLDKKEGAMALQNKISGLLFWIEKKEKPAILSEAEFLKLKPICESLIRKNQLEPEALSLFENET